MPPTNLRNRHRRFIGRATALFAVALAVALTVVVVLSVGAWPIHLVFHGSHGFASDIGIDSQGSVHAIFPVGRLYYATNAHGGWSVSVLDDVHEVWDAAMAIDSKDRIHIAYGAVLRSDGVEVGNPSIRYIVLDGGTRLDQVIDTYGRYPAISVDSMDRAHVTYVAWTTSAVKYATNAGGAWVNATVATTPQYPIYSAVAIDSRGKAHVTFTGFDESQIGYATNEDGNWTSELLVQDVVRNSKVPIAVDTFDLVHIAYAGCQGGCDRDTIFHAVRERGVWSREAIGSRVVTNRGNDLTLDLKLERNGRPHIVFNDEGSGALFHVAPAGGSRTREVIDRGELWALGGSLAVGGDGRVGIAYYRLDGGETNVGTSARVALSGVRSDNFLDFLSGVSAYLVLDGVGFATVGVIWWRKVRRARLADTSDG